MRIRKGPAGAFAALCILAGFAGLGRQQLPQYKQSDKVLHSVTFFLLTLCFYWILETNRRRILHLTLFVCTFLLGVGSEIVQGLLPNDRIFDPWDILANTAGSLAAIALSSWYHKRMLERKRKNKTYNLVPGEADDIDVELGEGVGGQESGVIRESNGPGPTVEEELDNWDENAEDWDAEEPGLDGGDENGKGDVAGDARKRDD
ncbi:hypothetical protein K490DRAFT_73990 [Saccharata proteae CBS 121410]|uniref:VanZ-like domain-containing protein n=1 Tax=Saccharata proteae CBS 121410 TaxID=1314787 RepID=A0A9P4HSI5_9PEZI|nr:hypothetical protein K490DRAFT_73990 [Saccharata proteae CBS 121410]